MIACISYEDLAGLLLLEHPELVPSLEEIGDHSSSEGYILDSLMVYDAVRKVFVDEHTTLSIVLICNVETFQLLRILQPNRFQVFLFHQ